jgi:DNA-binding MarR family transcriptional regulator
MELPDEKEIEDVAKAIKSMEFSYLARFADTINRYHEITLNKEGVNRLQWGAMSLLIVRGGCLTPTQLARFMFRSKHSITKVIDGLEKEGFVIRDRVGKDRRTIQVRITSAALGYMKQVFSSGTDPSQKVLSALDENDRNVLLNLVQRLQRKMRGYIPDL